jgi:hypothetical protein
MTQLNEQFEKLSIRSIGFSHWQLVINLENDDQLQFPLI